MSKLLNNLWLTVLLPICLMAAEAQVVNLSAVPRNPWNGKVDITYSLECATANAKIQLAFQAYDNDRGEAVQILSLSGDGIGDTLPAGGPYKTIWDSDADFPQGHSTDIAISVTVSDVTVSAPITGTYLVINLSDGTHRTTESAPSLSSDTCRTTELWLKRISAGEFDMGSPTTELGRLADETQHHVTLSKDYYIGIFELTQKQYQLITGSNPSQYTGDTRPVENVSYDDIRGNTATLGAGWPVFGHAVDSTSFLGKLRTLTSLALDLPTEAQWEFACRAGKTTALNTGNNLSDVATDSYLAAAGRYSQNTSDGKGSYSQHTKVGSYTANTWGLYDMHGNVAEWCLDFYGEYSTDALTNPTGIPLGGYHVLRGGHWRSTDAQYCRSASRNYLFPAGNDNYTGFRVCLMP